MGVRGRKAILLDSPFQIRMREARTLVLKGPGGRELNPLRGVHVGAS